MAVSRALALLWFGSASALRRDPALRKPAEGLELARVRHLSSAWRSMGNLTHASDLKVRSAIPELQGCRGFACIEKYVHFDDGSYSWGVQRDPEMGISGNVYSSVEWTAYPLKLTSQAWMANQTRKHVWLHDLEVIVPETYKPDGKNADLAILFLERELLTLPVSEMAARTGAITAVVAEVPNEDLSFPMSDPNAWVEEDIKAWSWYEYTRDASHPEWPIEMPNVKAVVRAMDTIAAFTRTSHGRAGLQEVKRFIITGHSKRAMAAYMAGAVDPRVVGLVPICITLNAHQASEELDQNLGGIPNLVLPYKRQGALTLTNEQINRLYGIVDPVNYMDRLTMPKLAIFAGADDVFPPDVTRSWWKNLPEPKMMYLYGNARHQGIEHMQNKNDKFLDTADAFINGLLANDSMPKIQWTIDERNGTIVAQLASRHTPILVTLWAAKTSQHKRRDFRQTEWLFKDFVNPTRDGRTYVASCPEVGKWCGFYLEFQYAAPPHSKSTYRLTTEVSVVPNVRPFPQAVAEDPKWQLVVQPR